MSNDAWKFQGLDHVAFTTSNMKRTVEFYNGLLGMPIIHAIEYQEADLDGNVSSVAQHYFFAAGGENPEAHIGFFQWRGAKNRTADPSSSRAPGDPAAPGAFGHLNLKVDADLIEGYCTRLGEAGIPYSHKSRYLFVPGEPLPDPRVQAQHNRTWRIKATQNAYHQPDPGWLFSSVYLKDPDGVNLEFNAYGESWTALFPAADVTPWGSDEEESGSDA
jgi:catechol 2,3-dioxygenase-like lactoylglutathione lyase family enzyme